MRSLLWSETSFPVCAFSRLRFLPGALWPSNACLILLILKILIQTINNTSVQTTCLGNGFDLILPKDNFLKPALGMLDDVDTLIPRDSNTAPQV